MIKKGLKVKVLAGKDKKKEGEVILNYVNFEGEPKQIFKRPDHVENYQRGKEKKEGYYGEIWRNAWVQSLDKWEKRGKNFRICQNNIFFIHNHHNTIFVHIFLQNWI